MENTDTETGPVVSACMAVLAASTTKSAGRASGLARALRIATTVIVISGARVAPAASHATPPDRDNGSCTVCDASATIIT